MTVISDVYFNVARKLSEWRRHQIIKLSHKIFIQYEYGLLLYLKLARVDVGSVSKKGENMVGIIT